MKQKILTLMMVAFAIHLQAQDKQDTVIVELAKTSRVVFTMRDKKDLEILKQYDFNELFQDILKKLEARDTTALSKDSTAAPVVAAVEEEEDWSTNDNDSDRQYKRRRTTQSFNFDLGTNNYLMNGKFPDADNAAYAVRPWGSWYFGFASIQRTRVSKNVFVEWGLGASWYNFKFENDNTVITKDDNGIQFNEDLRDAEFKKSKLTASYVMASFVPVIDFSDNSEKSRLWDNDGTAFRMGIGGYAGYRIASHSKLVYVEDGHREKDKEKDNFYLNNFRYGVRFQIGYRSTDLFFNYDLNELFSAGKGPKLNAFSFGVVF